MVAASAPYESPDEAIYRICREVTFQNEIGTKAVKERFASWLRAHPIEVSGRVPNVASDMVDRFFKRRQPKTVGVAQFGLFRPEAIVSIGKRKRAWMDDLSRDQFDQWAQTETKAFSQTRAAFEAKEAYWQDRLDHWGSYATLGDLERGKYGYVEPDIAPSDAADDENDE